MRLHATLTAVTFGLAGLLGAGGCTLTSTAVAPAQLPGLKRPGWAQAAPDRLTAREAIRLIDAVAPHAGDPATAAISPSDVAIVPGSFTRPTAEEAVVSFRRPGLGDRSWQSWLLEWRETSWYVVRAVAASCSGSVEAAAIERHGATGVLVRESCERFGRVQGRVRLLALGPRGNVELFAAGEIESRETTDVVASVRHSVWLTDVDGDGVPELVDMTFTEHHPRQHGDDYILALATTTRTIYKRDGWRFRAVPADGDEPAAPIAPERFLTTLW